MLADFRTFAYIESTASPACRLVILKQIFSSLNHRKVRKAELSRIITRKLQQIYRRTFDCCC